MADRAYRRVALLSVHPRFARAILDGSKKVELRRVSFSSDVRFVLIYATSPVQAIVGWFEVSEIVRRKPSTLWRRYRSIAGVSAAEFRKYYEGSEQGAAILVGNVGALSSPARLSAVRVSRPPQNFCYVRGKANRLIAEAS